MFVFFTSITVNECRFLGFVPEIMKLKQRQNNRKSLHLPATARLIQICPAV